MSGFERFSLLVEFCLQTEGRVVWTYSCGNKPVFSSPSLLPAGEVALGCVDGSVYIIDPDGKKAGGLVL